MQLLECLPFPHATAPANYRHLYTPTEPGAKQFMTQNLNIPVLVARLLFIWQLYVYELFMELQLTWWG